MSPTFAAGTVTYTSTAAATVTSLKVTATFASGTATAKTGSNTAVALITGQAVGDTTNLGLDLGNNTVTINSVEDGDYVITITRPYQLLGLIIKDQLDNDITLSPTFTSGTLTGYTVTVPLLTTSLKVTATFASGTATAKTLSLIHI